MFVTTLILRTAGSGAAGQGDSVVADDGLHAAAQAVATAIPTGLDDLTNARLKQVIDASNTLRARAERETLEVPTADERLARIRRLCRAKQSVDAQIQRVLDLRVALGASPDDEEQRPRARCFLEITSELLDLSGALNHLLRAKIIQTAFAVVDQPHVVDRLVHQLAADRSTIGASLMAPLLLDPAPQSPNNTKPATTATKRKILKFLSQAGRYEAAPIVVRFLQSREATGELVVAGADALCRLGLAQPAQEEGAATGSVPPPMTAQALRSMLRSVDAMQLDGASRQRRAVLLEWLDIRVRRGVGWTGYAVNGFVLEPGDWLLMRNISPYNQFTDLSPGLFTHAGVLALERDPQGVGRLVLVDLNERDARIGATNVEDALPSALYVAVLRHDDPAVARTMSETAASIIGNPAQFDLSFETARVAALRGQPLAGRRIETYCAGLLLLCAQATGLPRQEFFPVLEYPGSDRLAQNLQRIGLRLGADFVSPTGALFARRMKLVYVSEPMYDPARHVSQIIYNHFVQRMASQALAPRQNLFQSLRQELADASAGNPLLASALAAAVGVDRDTDLGAAARAFAVVETLDAIAATHSGEFIEAVAAVQAGPPEALARLGFNPRQIERIQLLRRRHAVLGENRASTLAGRRQTTRALIDYYTNRGKQQVNERFFEGNADASHGDAQR